MVSTLTGVGVDNDRYGDQRQNGCGRDGRGGHGVGDGRTVGRAHTARGSGESVWTARKSRRRDDAFTVVVAVCVNRDGILHRRRGRAIRETPGRRLRPETQLGQLAAG